MNLCNWAFDIRDLNKLEQDVFGAYLGHDEGGYSDSQHDLSTQLQLKHQTTTQTKQIVPPVAAQKTSRRHPVSTKHQKAPLICVSADAAGQFLHLPPEGSKGGPRFICTAVIQPTSYDSISPMP